VFLLSFITDLWTPRNVAIMIFTPPHQSKNSSRTPDFTPKFSQYWTMSSQNFVFYK